METVGDLLALRRRAQFVGRRSEIALFVAALDAEDPPWSVLFVHGPGGIGKTSLLDAFAVRATDTGTPVVRIDLRDVPLTEAERHRIVAAVRDARQAASSRTVALLLDSYEAIDAGDDALRAELLPALPTAALTVIAGRVPPGPAWRADQAWRDMVRVISLRNLGPDDSRALLRRCGVDPALHARMVAVSHGHPMALTLLADVVARGGMPVDDPLTPDLVHTLVRRFVEAVPSELHRRALEASALTRVTTEPLLRDALEIDDAHDVFTWLRELSFMDAGPDGIYPHDLARDVLDSDLRWRDPETYLRVFHRVRDHIHRRLRTARGHQQRQALYDEKFVFRNLRGILSPVDWDTWERHDPEPAASGDRTAIVELVRSTEGDASAAIARRWLERQPDAFHVSRADDGTVTGTLALLDLAAASADDIAADPGAEAAWRHTQRHGPPRPGEAVTQTRFVIDAQAYQGPSPTLNATPILTIQRYLQTPNLAWDFLTLFEPEPWNDYFALVGLPRAEDADFEVGGRRYGLFCHDFRQLSVDQWLETMTDRVLTLTPAPPPGEAPQVLVLSHAEFEDAVRHALKDLQRPELLDRNPLTRTRLVQDRDDDTGAAALRTLLRDAIDSLRAHPRDDKLLRAVEQLYVRPSRTQEAAAAALGLPFSTYRRHLTAGVARVVALLWDREVYGDDEHA